MYGETPDNDSDLDIAVIISKSNEKTYKRVQIGTLALLDIKKPIHLLVYTASEFNENINHSSTLQNKMLYKGVSLYETA